jgi:hypothetical protein
MSSLNLSDVEELLQASAPIGGASDTGTTDNDGTVTNTDLEKEDIEISELPWKKEQESAIKVLRSRFGDMEALVIARVVTAFPEVECSIRHSYTCTIRKKVLWACLATLYPLLALRFTAIAERINALRASVGRCTSGDTYSILRQGFYWCDFIVLHQMSPLEPRW